MATRNRLWGAIEVLNKLDGAEFNEHDLLLCETIAGQAAHAIEIAVLHRRLLASERLAAIGQTIAGMAHCIKNVLQGIDGGSYMVDLGVRKNDQGMLLKGWEIVKKNGQFMQDLVMDMLTYSKEREPEYQASDINAIVKAVCGLMAAKAEKRGVTISWQPNDDLGKVEVDPKGIQRCLLNLVSNAVDACEGCRDGRVHVSTASLPEEKFEIRVADTGAGILDEDKEKLFEMFFSTKGSKGTGLGLAVTHKIVSEHKGAIQVESRVGEGTTFSMVLPMKKI